MAYGRDLVVSYIYVVYVSKKKLKKRRDEEEKLQKRKIN